MRAVASASCGFQRESAPTSASTACGIPSSLEPATHAA